MAFSFGRAIQGLLGLAVDEVSASLVNEVNIKAYNNQRVHLREGFLTLYYMVGARKYEIVLQNPSATNKVFSLARSFKDNEATTLFGTFVTKLQPLLEFSRQVYDSDTLAKACGYCREEPNWLPVHIAAAVGLTDCIKTSLLQSHLNTPAIISGLTPLHLAVQHENIAFVNALVELEADVNVQDSHGNSPLYYALSKEPQILEIMLRRPCLETVNYFSTSLETLLFAACVNDYPASACLLLAHGADVGFSCRSYMYEMHGAAKAGSLGCIKTICELYPHEVRRKDDRHGGTALHWARDKQTVELLVSLGANLDTPSKTGDTPLHIMVEKHRLDCVIALLCSGASPDILNRSGMTALHVAVQMGDLNVTRALLVFGADMDAVTNHQQSVRHLAATTPSANKAAMIYTLHAVGAKRCVSSLGVTGCNSGCQPGETYNGMISIPPAACKPTHYLEDLVSTAMFASAMQGKDEADSGGKKRRGNVLCLDGGGIRGLILVQVLLAIEKIAGCPVIELFDWVSGTSTGGILALGLAVGRTAREAQGFYFGFKDKVFDGKRPYNSGPLEEALKRELGEHTRMLDIKNVRVFVTAVLADRHPADLHLFRNYAVPGEELLRQQTGGKVGQVKAAAFTAPPCYTQQLVWQAARASGAAPTFFKPLGMMLDGGLMANNPTLDMLTEVQQHNAACLVSGEDDHFPLKCVVSIGTGVEFVGTDRGAGARVVQHGRRALLPLRPAAFRRRDAGREG
ncbi:PREDICTED: 85/88 kDa calcium-independent phospholipase A2-like isoform X2 [Priapulus caudatus]|uniref:phospholipase A2 n=1 Tax=Priapulus caudatus TaxID=37621 RepID=A0ABM1EBJ7_PRICU|nr:PREDICTED: 85/88 kDa calcium-independent phospholipase A2-like isoform X2 [Priapulus caudatus]